MTLNNSLWKIWIDTGGTFTDCIAITPTGDTKRLKVLSSSVVRVKVESISGQELIVTLPFAASVDYFDGFNIRCAGEERTVRRYDAKTRSLTIDKPFKTKLTQVIELYTAEEVPVFAARILTETSLSSEFPPIDMKLGSTRGTNALLERKGARTVFIVTQGFGDLIAIGNQQRQDLFTLNIVKAEPLYHDVIEVAERIKHDGSIVTRLTRKEISRIIALLKKQKVESIAIAFVNSYKNSSHEQLLERMLRDAGYKYVSSSHSLSAQIKILHRAETTVVNAYLEPIIDGYLSTIQSALASATIKIMSSTGGLLEASDFKPKDSLLSGPAGGVVGAMEKARLSGIDKIITFDMGGTSTDVSRCDGRPDYRFDCTIGTLKVFSPSLSIETIAAGGGSICQHNGYKFIVGSHSAGADPGPACYGSGGPLTITDINLLLGRIDPENFSIPIHVDKSQAALDALLSNIEEETASDNDDLLQSFIDIANEKMAEAIRKISIQQGHDPKEYALLCFGGAGGQHACALASLLGMSQIVIPYDAGLLSAYGIGQAKDERIRERLILRDLVKVFDQLEPFFQQLYREAADDLLKHNPNAAALVCTRLIFLRLRGQETSLKITVSSIADIERDFVSQYKKMYGHYLDNREIEVESVRVIVATGSASPPDVDRYPEKYVPSASTSKKIFASGSWHESPVFIWENLLPGAYVAGPSLIISQSSTVFVDLGWSFSLDANQNGTLSYQGLPQKLTVWPGVAQLELFTNRFTALVEEMGTLLQRTSFSVNVKERLDFSCALLDESGNLVVNAPHIPVHLGSLGVCVRAVIKIIAFQDGDVIITNHPAFGGSHLPDITLIKPVFYDGKLAGFVVNRAHHAEIGGRTPGSMPSDATSLVEEGVIIAPTYLMREGVAQWKRIEELLTTAVYPSRAPEENLADLNAALAALQLGEDSFKILCAKYGYADVAAYMKNLRAHASTLMEHKIRQLSSRYTAQEKLDDGSLLKVTIEKNEDKLIIDFTGSSKVHSGNLNATEAIVNSVVLYVLRLLVDTPVPLNEGLLQPIRLVIPHGMLNPPFKEDNNLSPAVVGGNTEVSQRLTDTLIKAFGLAACSQGTMNNLLFGNARFGYYETICGGVGAGPGFHGATAVHQHMTNTRITDPEILESRYPVLLERFEVRKNSGGQGKWRGGNGIVRQFHFYEFLEVNILSQHRVVAPYGMDGGGDGQKGSQHLIKGTKKISIPGDYGFTVLPGDKLVIETPGGGGWGIPIE